MRFAATALFAMLVLLPQEALSVQDGDIVVRADLGRAEIERILALDNLDTLSRSPRDVADTMASIRRGRAPTDFWLAYLAHVRAWQRFASATETSDWNERLVAERAIDDSFDEVERIARRYGARLPTPARQSRPPTRKFTHPRQR